MTGFSLQQVTGIEPAHSAWEADVLPLYYTCKKERRHPDSNRGIGVLQTRALPLGYVALYGADDEARTRYLNLGKVALYQMSYIRILWCLRAESNHRHGDFQSPALPTELQRHMAIRNGIEPSTSSVTG